MGGINSLSGLNKINVDFRPTVEPNVPKTTNANQPQPAPIIDLDEEQQPPARNEATSVVRQLDVLLLNAAGKSVSADAVPSNTIESEVSWEKPANAADLKESACFFGLPLKNGQNKQIMLNGQEIQILNETKYGWFAKTMENPIFILYPGIEGKEMTLAFSGKVGVVMGSVKDANVTIRISFRESPIRFTITPK